LGKTFIFCSLLHGLGPEKRSLILAHRKELIDQPVERMTAYYPDWQGRVGVVMAETDQPDLPLTVATIQSLTASPRRLERILAHGPIDYLVTDECFPAGTLVDGRPIESIQAGDQVSAWSKAAGMTISRVVGTMQRPAPAYLVRITAGDRQIVCTYNHPILTRFGWRRAGELNTEEEIHVSNIDLQSMRKGVFTAKPGPGVQPAENRKSLLRTDLRAGSSFASDVQDQPAVCQPADESEQSDEKFGEPAENERYAASYGASSEDARREWYGINATATGPGDGFGRMGAGLPDPDRDGAQKRITGSHLLQGGRCQSGYQAGLRGRRTFSPGPGAPGAGPQEGCDTRLARVDRVEIFERGRDDEFERLCPDGLVYNLEVEGVHTYTANGIVVHNCHHHTDKNTYSQVLARLRAANPALRHLGVTATPIRADGDGLGGVYQKESFHYPINWGISKGYLVNIRWLAIEAAISLEGIKVIHGDFQRGALGRVYETAELLELVVRSYREYAAERQAIAFTVTVDGAHRLAQTFRAAGIEAASADGTTDKKERQDILDRFAGGRLQVLCNVGLYTEGLDVPQASCILMARPTRSDGLYVQCMGRALRLYPGKEDALILDFAPVDKRNVVMAGDVLGVPLPKKEIFERNTERGAASAGFTYDGQFTWMDGSPVQILSRQLNYLDSSPWSWYRSGGWLSLGLGKAADEIERTLLISPPSDGAMRLYGCWRNGGGWQTKELGRGNFDALQAQADMLAGRHGSAALAAKTRQWRREPKTDKQIAFARRLHIPQKAWQDLSKGELAQLITHTMAVRAVGGGL